jgi:hypothetical protein
VKELSKRSNKKSKPKPVRNPVQKTVYLLVILGLGAALITLVSVSINEIFGGVVPVVEGFVYWDWSIFFAFIIGLVFTPLITLYVIKAREDIKKSK